MDAKVRFHVPYIYRQFQGFRLKDIKEYISNQHMELHLESEPDRKHFCNRCGMVFGNYHFIYVKEKSRSSLSGEDLTRKMTMLM